MTLLRWEHHRYDDALATALVAELQEEYVERYGGPDATPVDPDEFAAPGGAFLVGFCDDVPFGTVGLRRHDDEQVEMKRLFVRRRFRGKGLARELLRAAEATAASLGYVRILAESGLKQPEALALYERSGYRRVPGFGHYRDSPYNRCFARDLAPTDG